MIILDKYFHRLLSFGLVGAFGTAAHYLTLVVLVEAIEISPVLGTTLGFVVGAGVNYILNHRFTFQSSKSHFDTGPKFFIIAVLTGALNTVLVYAGVSVLGLHYLLVQIGTTLAVFLANFVLNDVWTFRETDAK